MPSRSEVTYFGAGPAPLPTPILQAASEALLDFQSTGIGLVEHSHRSSIANQILADTKADLRALLDIPDDYEILFMQGGGSGQFSAVVYHMVGVWLERRRQAIEKDLLETDSGLSKEPIAKQVLERLTRDVPTSLKLDYLVTGSWSLKASQEAARLVGAEHINVAVDARTDNGGKFIDIPPEATWALTPAASHGHTPGPALIYYCDNETVDGVEFPAFPACLEMHGRDAVADEPLVVADMSSNILSRRVDVRRFAIIFAGAQKNLGTTGLTIVIVKKSLLPPHCSTPEPALLRALGLPIAPIIFDYGTIAKHGSLYNTLSIFDVWIAGQVLRALRTTHGAAQVSGVERLANAKARLIYAVLDRYPQVYQVVPRPGVRSRMNICFRVAGGQPAAEAAWLEGAEERHLMGLKGHRSVGGIRCSNYNAIPMAAATKLVEYLEMYARKQLDGKASSTKTKSEVVDA
ncbi:MAG: Phosphoserine transaminase [Phylliscum demangeonii]|nr:MAG: Phosphoserine transaminase [Phylliscum demangeonii]